LNPRQPDFGFCRPGQESFLSRRTSERRKAPQKAGGSLVSRQQDRTGRLRSDALPLRRQYLDAPQDDGDGSNDACSREGALQDMDLHVSIPFSSLPRAERM